MFPVKAGNSIDVNKLAERLEQAAEGELVEYDELSKVIGRSILTRRWLLEQARKLLQREKQIIFDASRTRGLVRLGDEGKAAIGKNAIKHIRRTAKRGCEKMACVNNFDAMSDSAKAEHNFSMSILGAIAASTNRKPLAQIEAKTKTATMPTAEVLRELAG